MLQCKLSKTFWKSKKLMWNGLFHSRHCSMRLLSLNIWSVHPLPFRKPACSCLSSVLIAISILPSKTRQKTLDGMDSNVIPSQLSQFCRLPFFGILAIKPLAQSSGMTFLSQMFLNRSVRTLTDVLRSAFSISAWMESMPTAFPFFVALMALKTSRLSWGDWSWCWACQMFWLRAVEDLTKVLHPSRCLFSLV